MMCPYLISPHIALTLRFPSHPFRLTEPQILTLLSVTLDSCLHPAYLQFLYVENGD